MCELTRRDAKNVMAYYCSIPSMLRLLDVERRELEREYNGLHSTSDAPICKGGVGHPTESQASHVITDNVWGRIQDLDVRRVVIERDRVSISGCVDALHGDYKRLLLMRYRDMYTWAKISVLLRKPERTAKFWQDKALDRLAELLSGLPMADELAERAYSARL